MNKIGIHYAYWIRDWEADFTFYAQKAAMLGFDVLEITTDSLFKMTRSELDKLKRASEESNIELTYCVGFPGDKDLASADQTIRKNGIEYAKRNLELINIMGGKIFAGINYSSWQPSLSEGITDKRPWLERSLSSIRQIIGTAEGFGIDYCIEIVNRYEQFLLNTVAEGIAFIEEVGNPSLKLLLDVFHMNIEEDSIGEAIVTAGEHVGHLHIGECNRHLPGRGHMPWHEIINALKKINYSRRIVMEPFVKMGGEVGREIKIWRNLIEENDINKLDTGIKEALVYLKNLF